MDVWVGRWMDGWMCGWRVDETWMMGCGRHGWMDGTWTRGK